MNRTFFTGAIIVFTIFVMSFFAKYITSFDPVEQNVSCRLQPPSKSYIFGTDELGRDVFSRVLYSGRVSLSVGIISVGIAVVIGTLVGLVSGYFGGKVDVILMRIVDIVLCFPTFFLILMVIAFLKPSIYNIMIVIGITSWPSLARYIRAEVLSVKEREYIWSARLAGISTFRILFFHILPNVIIPVLVNFTLGMGGAILTESALSFLGLGVQPPQPSWGNILSSGKDYIHIAWWLSVFPGMAIFITVMGFNLIGEGIRKKFNVKEKR